MALIDDDDVPPGLLEVVSILQAGLECIDRNDGAVVVIERIVVGRDTVTHTL
ncbi:hypothetical protein D3C84_1259020 [compost metagenome]